MRAISALVLREMATYGTFPGGFLWAVLEPVLGIGLLTLIFSAGFRAPSLGVNFPIFYATGMVPFLLYTEVSGRVAQALLFSRPLLAYPSVTCIDAILGRFLLNLMVQLIVAYLVMGGILVLFETRTSLDPAAIALAFAMAAALAFGVGTLNAFLFTRLPVWQRIWSILTRPLFLLSCIFFTFETVPETYAGILWHNPLVHVVGQMRAGFYPTYDAGYVSATYVFGMSLGAAVVGLILLRRHARDLLREG